MTRAALRPVLVLALDGATFDVVRPMAEAGELPNLARWLHAGQAAPLPSVLPPVTFPAWSSFMTGLSPGEHGIFDFTQKMQGRYRIRFVNASDRAGDSLFRAVDRAGGRVLVLGLPATYPPERVNGLLVSGFDAPVSTGTDARSASDPALYDRIAARVGPWMRPDLDESARDEDFHERAVATLLDRIERKTRFALEALRQLRDDADGRRPDLMMVVFSESDTVGHHYWRDHDPESPRHDPEAPAVRRDAVAAVYRRLDEACGRIRDAYGEDALCVVLSDHGMGGAARRIVHLNRFLEERGFLVRTERSGADRLARSARDRALRWLPPPVAQAIFRRARGAAARVESAARFGGLDWRRTRAFSEEANTFPGVWINLRGREAQGCVAPDAYEKTRDELIAALEDWRLPHGDEDGESGRVVARAWRREALYDGPFVERAPDVVVELALDRGYGLSLVPTPWGDPGPVPALRTLGPDEWAGGRGRGMNGTHRRDGIWIAHGPGASPEAPPLLVSRSPDTHAGLVDAAPTLAAAMGIEAPNRDDRARRDPAAPRVDYSPEEDALVARRLRALGYLE